MSCCRAHGWRSLCLSVTAIVIVWTVILPWIGSQQPIRSRIEYLDQRGIDPTALYYTDLEAMQRLESDLTAITRSNPNAFWSIRADVVESIQ